MTNPLKRIFHPFLASTLLVAACLLCISNAQSALPPGTVLQFDDGVPNDSSDSNIGPPEGSFFVLGVSPETGIFSLLERGPDGGIVLGRNQPAGESHGGLPNSAISDERPGVDEPWPFIGNTGMHFTDNGGIVDNGDGTLEFSNRWFITWNGIPAIDLGGCETGVTCLGNVVDTGKATLTCLDANENPIECRHGTQFEVDYDAHVPDGDSSGFGGVPYSLHLEGTIVIPSTTLLHGRGRLRAGATAAALGSLDGRLTDTLLDSLVSLDTGVRQRCVGGCFDFEIEGLTAGESARIVLPLSVAIPKNAVYRKFNNGEWATFNLTTGDTLASAPRNGNRCPEPDSPAYTPALTAGDFCVLLTIADGGPNDTNLLDTIVGDPGGVGITSDGSSGGGSGCTASKQQLRPWQAGHFVLLGMFLIGLQLRRTKRNIKKFAA